MELDRRGAELLFHFLIEREVQNSVAIASSVVLFRLDETFTDPSCG